MSVFDKELEDVSVRENIRDMLFYRDHGEEEVFPIDDVKLSERETFLKDYKGPKDYDEAEMLYKECMHSYFGGFTVGGFLDDIWERQDLKLALLSYMLDQYCKMHTNNPYGLNQWDEQNLRILNLVGEYLLKEKSR
tara:strand:+ start:3555 stop:3962 length:408 start_codon:yes stop_codon:yes gene_type:complete